MSTAARGISLAFAVLVATGGTVLADNRYPPPPMPPMPPPEDYYSGPPILRHIPGFRILFGDYALTEDEFNALYGRKKHRNFDESYYVPEAAPPVKKVVKPKPAVAGKPVDKPVAKPAQQQPQQQASAAPPPNAPAGGMSCEKATEVVSGYGFSSVEAASCAGKIYAFNAKRDGKNFSIKLDSASGALKEVKKLP